MKVFLHIGIEKTGTTTIQNFLAVNREQFLKAGIFYPKTPGHTNHIKLFIAAAKIDNNLEDIRNRLHGLKYNEVLEYGIETFKHNFLKNLEDETNRILKNHKNIEYVFFSSELCSSRLCLEEEIWNLKELLQKLFSDIYIIIYLRRQDELLLSTYSTKVIFNALTQHIALPDQELIDNYYDYQKILRKWESVFGKEKMIVKVFEKEKFINNNLLSDFFSIAGIQIDRSHYQDVMPKNESYSAEILSFIRMMNYYIPRYVENSYNPERQELLQQIKTYKNQDDKYILMSSEARKSFLKEFENSNAYVAKYYLGYENKNLFESQVTANQQDVLRDLSLEESFKVFTYLWRHQHQEIDRLKQVIHEQNKTRTRTRDFKLSFWKAKLSKILSVFTGSRKNLTRE